MRSWINAFRAPKAGASLAECEDAYGIGPSPAGEGAFDGRWLRVAVSDGASEAMLAARWASELVQHAVSASWCQDFVDAVDAAIGGWEASVAEYIAEREANQHPLQWYEEPGIEQGAYATIVALWLDDPLDGHQHEGRFDAWALGDSCLFQVRDDSAVAAFPIHDASAFDTSPALVHSKTPDLTLVHKHIHHIAGTWQSGDTFYLATDALSQWFLSQIERGGRPWQTLCDLGTDAMPIGFDAWVDEQRRQGELRNDDTTLLRIDVW